MRTSCSSVHAALLALVCLGLTGCGDGHGWIDYHLPAPGYKVAFWAAGPDRIWVLGIGASEYSVHVIEDGEPRPVPEVEPLFECAIPLPLKVIWGTSDQDIWIHSLAHFDGTRWTQGVPPPAWGSSLWGFDREHYYLARGDGLSVFDGEKWSAEEATLTLDMPAGNSTGIFGSGPSDIHVVFASGKLVHFDGQEWTRKDSPVADAIHYGVWARSPSEAWAVGCHEVQAGGLGPGLLVSWNGQEWKLEDAPDPEPLHHVTGCGGDRLVVATEHKVYERQGNGAWASVFEATDKHTIRDIHCAAGALMVCEAGKETIVWVRR